MADGSVKKQRIHVYVSDSRINDIPGVTAVSTRVLLVHCKLPDADLYLYMAN